MQITPEMKQLKEHAKQAFKGIDGVEGIGLGGEAKLIVYCRDKESANTIPDFFKGYAVQKIVSGKIIAGVGVAGSEAPNRPTLHSPHSSSGSLASGSAGTPQDILRSRLE